MEVALNFRFSIKKVSLRIVHLIVTLLITKSIYVFKMLESSNLIFDKGIYFFAFCIFLVDHSHHYSHKSTGFCVAYTLWVLRIMWYMIHSTVPIYFHTSLFKSTRQVL